MAPAPPHTRGSTRPGYRTFRVAGGSPAHAGIDPSRVIVLLGVAGLPRTRGDRPSPALVGGDQPGAPPHTRGSTRLCWPSSQRLGGSPAHAGIDPRRRRAVRVVGRLPRTRGDRPRDDRGGEEANRAPPHTRGSTRPDYGGIPACLGSPAHAGIDLETGTFPTSYIRLPRTRGDRPPAITQYTNRQSAPPHTRGSTPGVVDAAGVNNGSPAHAGIDL